MSNDLYTIGVTAGTRNHRGSSIQNTAYVLVETTDAGWAFICTMNGACHYVDPDALRYRKGG